MTCDNTLCMMNHLGACHFKKCPKTDPDYRPPLLHAEEVAGYKFKPTPPEKTNHITLSKTKKKRK